MNRISILACCAAGLLGMAGGCQNTVNTVENADKSAAPTYVNDKRVVTDGALRNRLAVAKVAVGESPNGMMVVQVEVTNMRTGFFSEAWSSMTGENPYRINYRFRWFDEKGMAVSGISSVWQEKIIYPGESAYLESVAPSRDCRDFLLDLQEAE
ncbi:MAG: YcfL family protein [Victivallaceae bacterium]|nr:YcfL family protein [Victivallaceae bacterium]